MKLQKVSKERNQTLSFLSISKNIPAITLIREVNVSHIVKSAKLGSMTAITIKAISDALAKFPDLNVMVKFGSSNTLICLNDISVRLTLEKTLNGVSGVYSRVIKNTDIKTVMDIEKALKEIKHENVKESEHYRKIRLIQQLPGFLAAILMKLALRSSKTQAETWGSFTVTSLGKNGPDMCIPISGSTFTFTLGAVSEKPIVAGEEIVAAWVANLVMVFDHRVLDGKLASQLLGQVKQNIEHFPMD
ncbi:2-oxo acid dehydrogenase subunit E2 [Pectobacteriaceae bacterium CE90]|nr:2-oxo acid dehydrogenase subunit E2 [Pectobacteriaceae bacterium CE90]